MHWKFPRTAAQQRAVVVVACILAFASTGPAATAEVTWQEQLTRQIGIQHDCEVAFISNVLEQRTNGDLIIFAKVHCEDKRTFDAHRARTEDLFQIKTCPPPDQRVC